MHLTSWKHDRKCAACGKSTSLNVHQSCGSKFPHKKVRKLKPYSETTIRIIAAER